MCKALMSLRLDLEGRISRKRIRLNRDEEMGGRGNIMGWRLLNRKSWIISRDCLSLLMGHDDVGDPTGCTCSRDVAWVSSFPSPNQPHHKRIHV